MSPRIGFVVPSLAERGGVPAVAKFLTDVATKGGFSTEVVSVASSRNDPASVQFTNPRTWAGGVRSVHGRWTNGSFTHVGVLGAEVEFLRYLPNPRLNAVLSECDLIQVVCGSPAWAWSVLNAGKPVAVQCATRAAVERRHGGSLRGGPLSAWRRLMAPITGHIEDYALTRVDAIQVENAWMLAHVQALNASRPDIDIRLAPPGIDTSLFRPPPAVSTGVDVPYILCVGRLADPRKNPDLLLRAFSQLVVERHHRHLRLILAGASPPPPVFWQQAVAMGVRHLVQFIDSPSATQLVALYQGASVVALPSHEEGLGIVLLEAMACGVPVVATRCGGPETIVTDGHDGFLVNRGDAGALASAVERLLTDETLRRRLGSQARNTVEARFSASVAGAQFIEVWSSLIRRVATCRSAAYVV
jgi:glycosyltransferase involved in cell wall biosynthesis